MSTEIFDSNNEPVPSDTPIGRSDQQLADAGLNIVNIAREDGNLALINSKLTTTANGLRIDGGTVSVQASDANGLTISQVTNPVTILSSSASGLTINGTIVADIGNTGGLALDSTVSTLEVDQGSTTSGQKGMLVQAAVTTSDPSYLTGQTSPLSLTTSGRLRIDASASSSDPSIAPTATNISGYVKALKVYTVTLSVNMTSAGIDNPLMLIRNPTGSAKTMYIYKTTFGVSVNNVWAKFKLFSNPTVTTNGTSITSASNNAGGGAPSSLMLATSLPTVSASGEVLNNYVVAQNANSLTSVDDFSVHVQPNNSILITGNPQSNNRQAELTVTWAEV